MIVYLLVILSVFIFLGYVITAYYFTVLFSWWTETSTIINYPSFSQIILFYLNIYFDSNIDEPAFFWLVFAWCIFFWLATLSLEDSILYARSKHQDGIIHACALLGKCLCGDISGNQKRLGESQTLMKVWTRWRIEGRKKSDCSFFFLTPLLRYYLYTVNDIEVSLTSILSVWFCK